MLGRPSARRLPIVSFLIRCQATATALHFISFLSFFLCLVSPWPASLVLHTSFCVIHTYFILLVSTIDLPSFSLIVLGLRLPPTHNPQGSRVFLHAGAVSALLNDLFGLQTRAGCLCAGPYAQDLLGIDEETVVSPRCLPHWIFLCVFLCLSGFFFLCLSPSL